MRALPSILITIIMIFALPSVAILQDTVIKISDLPNATQEQLNAYDFCIAKTLGVSVVNPMVDSIGLIAAYHNYRGFGDAYWQPVNGKKMILSGILEAFFIHDDGFYEDEYDWNLRIIPNLDFLHLIYNLPPYKYLQASDEFIDENDHLVQHKVCNLDGNAVPCMYAEVTPDQSFYDNPFFPNRYIIENGNITQFIQPDAAMLFHQICVYGAWVRDSDHQWWPEIHPIEAIWWKKTSEYADTIYIINIQDDSNRFDNKSDYTDRNVAAWTQTPQTTEIKIPFLYNGKYKDHLKLSIEELYANNVVTGEVNGMNDSDDGKNHILKLDRSIYGNSIGINDSDPIIAEVIENYANGSHLQVSFSDKVKKTNGEIIGCIKLLTSYGKRGDDHEGYHCIKVTINKPILKVRENVLELRE